MDDGVNLAPGISRRDLLRSGAVVGGTLVWAAPAVQTISRAALAQTVGTAPPEEHCPGWMTGGGALPDPTASSPNRVITYGLGRVDCDRSAPSTIEVNWGGDNSRANQFHSTNTPLLTARCWLDPAYDARPPTNCFNTIEGSASGTLRLDGEQLVAATLYFTFIDKGEPGINTDHASLRVVGPGGVVLEQSGTVIRGNLQAHAGAATGNQAECPPC